jgi:hypothetical protein
LHAKGNGSHLATVVTVEELWHGCTGMRHFRSLWEPACWRSSAKRSQQVGDCCAAIASKPAPTWVRANSCGVKTWPTPPRVLPPLRQGLRKRVTRKHPLTIIQPGQKPKTSKYLI